MVQLPLLEQVRGHHLEGLEAEQQRVLVLRGAGVSVAMIAVQMSRRSRAGPRGDPSKRASRHLRIKQNCLRFGWLPLLLALAGACGGGSQPEVLEPERTGTAALLETEAVTVPKPAVGGHAGVQAPIDAALVSRLLGDPETSEHVRRAVEDGVITFAEYEASVFGFIACMEAHGFTSRAVDLKLNIRGVYSWRVTRPTDPNAVTEDERQARAIEGYTLLSACEAEAFGGGALIDYWWKQGVWPSEQELQAAMDELVECLDSGGLGPLLPTTRTYEEFTNNAHRFLATADAGIHAVFLGCARRVQDEWGLIGFVWD